VIRKCGRCGFEGDGFTKGKLLAVTESGDKIFETICPKCKRHYSCASWGVFGA